MQSFMCFDRKDTSQNPGTCGDSACTDVQRCSSLSHTEYFLPLKVSTYLPVDPEGAGPLSGVRHRPTLANDHGHGLSASLLQRLRPLYRPSDILPIDLHCNLNHSHAVPLPPEEVGEGRVGISRQDVFRQVGNDSETPDWSGAAVRAGT